MRTRLCFVFLFFISLSGFAQDSGDAYFSSSTDFRTVTQGFVRITFTLSGEPEPALVENALSWATANQGRMELHIQGTEVRAAMSADANSSAAWSKLFLILGVSTFEISDAPNRQVLPIDHFFQYFEI